MNDQKFTTHDINLAAYLMCSRVECVTRKTEDKKMKVVESSNFVILATFYFLSW